MGEGEASMPLEFQRQLNSNDVACLLSGNGDPTPSPALSVRSKLKSWQGTE